ncbi:extracellular solute-binding protein [Paenibacillus sp. J2TS4]|uniref:extracellular solute-binding protein n=1 Tax=Paenibacillus sp. J2TS4 TaxID=2807194 RepID=UPI001B03ACFB|nr:extracellular solute-binding protein [Paenibacillus sp. J2TS4]GIP33894.1 hypothetical protein J2TS4_31040 [Paenibacillus sp. J2TS4]
MTNRPSRKTFRDRLDDMVQRLKEEILTSRLQIGDYLPSEKKLGEQFGLSNKSVRKGLDILVSEGLIVKVPKVGNRVARPEDDRALTVRFGYHRSITDESDLFNLLERFHEQYPQIKVQAVPIMNDSGVIEYLEAGLLDVATINYPLFQTIQESGRLALLEEQPVDPHFYPFVTKAFMMDAALKAKPFMFSPLVLCYNREHLRESGLLEPDSGWTWQDLSRAASILARPDERLGFYFHLQSRNRWPVLLLQSGESLQRGEDGRPRLKDSRWLESFRISRDLVGKQRIPPVFDQEADVEELFKEGRASMILTSYFALNRLKHIKLDWDLAPLPHHYNAKTLLLVIGLVLNAKSSQKEASQKLIDFLTSYASQLAIRHHTLSIPALKPAAEWTGEEKLYRPGRFHLYREIASTFSYYSELGLSNSDIIHMTQQAKLYWSGLYDERQLCERLEEMLERNNDEL